jgi:cephalosporin hydroxylase
LALLDICDAIDAGTLMDPRVSNRKVIGVDIDIRPHNRAAIEAHPLAGRIAMIQGSSIDPATVLQVKEVAKNYQRILVLLDSMHTHEHVLAELEAYAPMVSLGSYCVIFDTFVDDMPAGFFANRPWDVGNNPKTAVRQWLKGRSDFQIDESWPNKLMVTVAPDGFLKRMM